MKVDVFDISIVIIYTKLKNPMNKLVELFNSFLGLFKKNNQPENQVFGGDEEYDAWLGI